MSTEYGFRCRSHNPNLTSPADLRYDVAKALLNKRAEVDILRAWESADLITFGAGNGINYGVGAAVAWLGQHPECDVVLVDEYGRVETIAPPRGA